MTTHLTATSARAPLSPATATGLVEQIYDQGIVGLPAAFDRDWVAQLDKDVMAAFDEARGREGGAVGRGPNRFYVEVHPEQLRGFADLAGHPWVTAVCAGVLGPDYEIIEIGFDIPFPGAVNQPWHRDFPMPAETRDQRRLTSLAVNVTTVDTEPDMGPLEIAPGTQWDPGDTFEHGMFPAPAQYPRYEQLAQRKYPQMGDLSIRSALTIHRGTTNHSGKRRPVVVLGVDAPGAGNADRHDMAVTRAYRQTLDAELSRHLPCPDVEVLEPIVQKHTIEGLVMGAP